MNSKLQKEFDIGWYWGFPFNDIYKFMFFVSNLEYPCRDLNNYYGNSIDGRGCQFNYPNNKLYLTFEHPITELLERY